MLGVFVEFFVFKLRSHLEVVFASIFDRFFVSLKLQKLSCRRGASSIFKHFSMFKLAPFWKRFWTPKDLQYRSISRCQNDFKITSFLEVVLASIFNPTWPQHGPKLAPSWGPRSIKNRSWAGFGANFGSKTRQD